MRLVVRPCGQGACSERLPSLYAPCGASSRSRGERAGVLVVWRGSVPRGEDCALCRGRTFIKDGYVLISVICNRTQSSCGKYVPTGPRRQRCRHVEPVGELVGDTMANRLCGCRTLGALVLLEWSVSMQRT